MDIRRPLTVDACVCTRNPRRDVFQLTLAALARQTLDKRLYQVLIVDNGSTPPLAASDCRPLIEAGVAHRIVREPRPGVAFARLRAIVESSAPLTAFVDDDNELCDDYLAAAISIFTDEAALGCAGPRLLPAPSVRVPDWLKPVALYLAIRGQLGDEPITAEVRDWNSANPPGAGLVARREVLELYRRFEDDLGAVRHRCEDLLMTLQAHRAGLLCGYRPRLQLYHHLDARRFDFPGLCRLFARTGRCEVAAYRLSGGGMPWTAADIVRCIFGRLTQVHHREQSPGSGALLFLQDLSRLAALAPEMDRRAVVSAGSALLQETTWMTKRIARTLSGKARSFLAGQSA